MRTTVVEPRWLDELETDAWKAVVVMLLRLSGQLDSKLQRDSGLSQFDYRALSFWSMAPDRSVRISELAQRANGSLSRLSNVVKRMEGQGWVLRHPDPTDGRCTVATLTDEGFEVVRAAAPAHVDAVRRYVIDPLNAGQLRALAGVGQRLIASLEDPGR